MIAPRKKRIIGVWSGGGLPALDLHAGMAEALDVSGVNFTENSGTSAGAIAGALNSSGYSSQYMKKLLLALKDEDVLPERFMWKWRLMWIDHWVKNDSIIKILHKRLPATFKGLRKPLIAWATDERYGHSVAFDRGELMWAVLASMSISGVFPPVCVRGQWYCDGGTSYNLPLPFDWHDADEVYLLIAKRPCDYRKRTRTVVGRLLRNADLYAEDQISDVLMRVKKHTAGFWTEGPKVFVIRPQVQTPRGALHFDHRLISTARQHALKQLADQRELFAQKESAV